MRLRPLLVCALACLLALSGSLVAAPTDATARESPTRIDDCTTITEPGVYELTADVGETSDADRRACIVVRSEDVTIDGNGYTIAGAQNGIFVGTAIPFLETESLPNVTVRDAVVTSSVELYRAPGATVRNVTARDSFIWVGDGNGSVLADNTLRGTPQGGAGISVFRSNGTLVANNTVIDGAEPNEYFLDSGSIRIWYSDDVSVHDNVVRSNATGLDVYNVTNSTFTNNAVTGRNGRGLAITESRDNVVEDTVVSDSAVGIMVSGSAGNTFQNVTVTDTSDVDLNARKGGRNRFDGLRIAPNTTVSMTGRNVVVRGVDAPPAVPSDLVTVGGFFELIQYRGAEVSLDVAYDAAAVEAAGLDESDLRLYRYPAEETPSHVYAPMGSRAGTAASDGWESVPGPNRVNVSANVVSADVREFDFDDLDTPTDATPIDVGETVNGTITSDESDWYAFEVEAGEAILPTLNLVGPLENRAIEFSIVGPDGTDIRAFPNDGIHGNDYEAGAEHPAQGRQASGAATAETNGTYYVRVFPGETNTQLVPGAYNLTVETRELDPFDPNQRRETATPIEVGERVTGTAGAYDEDWFTFEAEAGERLTIDAEVSGGTAGRYGSDYAISVYGPDGQELDLRDGNLTAGRTGQYFVRFHESDINWVLLQLWPYTLTVRTTEDDRSADTDGDGLTDGEEEDVYGTDPTETDTDGDGWSDLSEVNRDCDPLDPLSHP